MGKTLELLLAAVVVGGLAGYAVLVLEKRQQATPVPSNPSPGPGDPAPENPSEGEAAAPGTSQRPLPEVLADARMDLSPNRPDGLIGIGPGPRRWE